MTSWVKGTIFGLPEVDPDVLKMIPISELGRSSLLGSTESPWTMEGLSVDSMGFKAILGNGQFTIRCSKEGLYKIILDSAFSMSPKMTAGWVNIGHM
jgi:hypothetical protein